jgi:thiamine-monophosphate kinase
MSELDRIERLTARFYAEELIVAGGDDAAVVVPGGAVSVTSVDAVVDGVHFSREDWPLSAVGHKAVAAALSDLAAMGAAPGELYVAAGIPKDLSEAEFDQLTEGFAAAAEQAGANVAGGDLVASGPLWLSVTVVGYAADAQSVVTRKGASPGDLLVVTGDFGGAARALALIADDVQAGDPALTRQFAPVPRLAAGQALAKHGASAMIDVSDGLAGDAAQLASASAVELTIEAERVPLAEGVVDYAEALASGEEYELLAAIPESAFEAAAEEVLSTGTRLTVIGRVGRGDRVRLVDADGVEIELELRGFDHFD